MSAFNPSFQSISLLPLTLDNLNVFSFEKYGRTAFVGYSSDEMGTTRVGYFISLTISHVKSYQVMSPFEVT